MIPDLNFELATAKGFLRVLHNHEDSIIELLLDGAVSRCEEYLGRALTERQRVLTIGRGVSGYDTQIPPRIWRLPLGPVTAITQFDYRDKNGAIMTAPPGAAVVGYAMGGHYTIHIEWPADLADTDEVLPVANVQYTTAPDWPAGEVPADIKLAVLMTLADSWTNRESAVVGSIITTNPAAAALLAPHKVNYFA